MCLGHAMRRYMLVQLASAGPMEWRKIYIMEAVAYKR